VPCVKCGNPLAQPRTGRRAIYCSASCRRSAEFEIRRVQRALEAVERNIRRYQRDVATEDAGFFAEAGWVKAALAESERQRDELEARLLTLLADPSTKADPK
jgi:hypothetical protein